MSLKENIQNQFNSYDVSSFSIFDPKKMPKHPKDCSAYGNESIQTLLQHIGKELPAESVLADEFVRPAFCQYCCTN